MKASAGVYAAQKPTDTIPLAVHAVPSTQEIAEPVSDLAVQAQPQPRPKAVPIQQVSPAVENVFSMFMCLGLCDGRPGWI